MSLLVQSGRASRKSIDTRVRLGQQHYQFTTIDNQRYGVIENVEEMEDFFISLVSHSDQWFFISSNGALSAGRNSPETALFPYYTVDKITDNWNSTGSYTAICMRCDRGESFWEPFRPYMKRIFRLSRRLLKSTLGDRLIFEESNHDLGLCFRYCWQTSERYGFVRTAEIINVSGEEAELRIVDGLQNFLPSGVGRQMQSEYSCLADAYKISEIDSSRKLLTHRLVAGIVDEAIPLECLRATVVWSSGWDDAEVLIDEKSSKAFLDQKHFERVEALRARRGVYLLAGNMNIAPGEKREWMIATDIEQSQNDVSSLRRQLDDPKSLEDLVRKDIDAGSLKLCRLVASSDGLQLTSDENSTVHHYANTLFNIMRGGVFVDGYQVDQNNFADYIAAHSRSVFDRHCDFLDGLPSVFSHALLQEKVSAIGDPQLWRLTREYLPLTFSRRHGDPSRPWNRFSISPRNESGEPVVSYEGNWRDIFQNWEALVWSFPCFIDGMITKFLNASTADGYNPYRVTDQGIDWEVLDPDDPWASIGYWGDHQIVYLLKLLEFKQRFNPGELSKMLTRPEFAYANVPYRIRGLDELHSNPQDTIDFDTRKNRAILEAEKMEGTDARLLKDNSGEPLLVTLAEKLLVPLLTKLSNFVPDAGIWMNTQRPEWNDANNALVGCGASLVTTCYLNRYMRFLDDLVKESSSDEIMISKCAAVFLDELNDAFELLCNDDHTAEAALRYTAMERLGKAGERYRNSIYRSGVGGKVSTLTTDIRKLVANAGKLILETIRRSRRADGLYHSYNLLKFDHGRRELEVEHLSQMLEGQVAVLSSGALTVCEANQLLEILPESPLYCPRRHSYMLYPDRDLEGFLDKNRIIPEAVEGNGLLGVMVSNCDYRIVGPDPAGGYRFGAEYSNGSILAKKLTSMEDDVELGGLVREFQQSVLDLYESTFQHRLFTGRSGTMFAYEGLGSVYWHMVSKLMLAVQENAILAFETEVGKQGFDDLLAHYRKVQSGLGFRKTPQDYGAFPVDAYSHTPAHAGAQQPGLTGQVKEGILCRFGELGVCIEDGCIAFRPIMLNRSELLSQSEYFEFFDQKGNLEKLLIRSGELCFTLVQVPVIYRFDALDRVGMTVVWSDGREESFSGDTLPLRVSREIFCRMGSVAQVKVTFHDVSLA